jgi:predicted transcriptional regulator YdeE
MSEWLEALGHEYHVVQSVGDVLDLVEVWQEAWSGDKTAPRIS